MSYEIRTRTENISAQRDTNLILLTEVLFHLSGHGSASEGATLSYITDSRISILGLSNKVSFVSESHVVAV